MEQLSQFYRQVMESINLQIDEHGNAMYIGHDGPMPFLVSDGRKKFAIIHPTRESLRLQDPTKQWAFHPLCESVVRGQSPMLKALRQGCMARLEMSIGMLMVQLLELAADTEKHSKISAKGLDLLRHIPKADVETVERMGKILNVLNGEDRKFINFYVKQGGEVRGQQAQRSTIVTFPFAKEFTNAERRIYTVDLRKKDMETIPALFDWLFPGSQDINTYSAGSSSAVAPYFHSLMTAYVSVAKRINQVYDIFKKHLEPEVHIQLDFADQLDNLIVFRDAMPPMNGNDGEVTHHSGSAAERVQQNVEKQTLAMPAAPAPARRGRRSVSPLPSCATASCWSAASASAAIWPAACTTAWHADSTLRARHCPPFCSTTMSIPACRMAILSGFRYARSASPTTVWRWSVPAPARPA